MEIYSSLFLTDTENRYAMVELELLAVVWAAQKGFFLHLLGLLHFQIATDHRPLVLIMDKHTLDRAENPRLKCLKKLQPYNFSTIWRKENEHEIPDPLTWIHLIYSRKQSHTKFVQLIIHSRKISVGPLEEHAS